MSLTIEQQVQLVATTALAKQANHVVELAVGPIIGITDTFVILSSQTDRQLKAIMEYIEDALREEAGRKPLRIEGAAATGWLILDFGDYVIHGFTDEMRDFYALERLWSDAPRVEHEDPIPTP